MVAVAKLKWLIKDGGRIWAGPEFLEFCRAKVTCSYDHVEFAWMGRELRSSAMHDARWTMDGAEIAMRARTYVYACIIVRAYMDFRTG
jgi:hypothetical protein